MTNAPLAIKFAHSVVDEEALERERIIQKHLPVHPNIVCAFGAGTVNGSLVLIFELYYGSLVRLFYFFFFICFFVGFKSQQAEKALFIFYLPS